MMVILSVMMEGVWDHMMFVMDNLNVNLEKMKKTVVRRLLIVNF